MQKKAKSAKLFLRKILEAFMILGLQKIINNRLKEINAKPPDVKRVDERLNQLSFSKQINYYTIKVRTSVNEDKACFNKTGKIWILVVRGVPGIGEEVVFIRYFRRLPGAYKKVINLVSALNFELSNRPSDSKGKFMNLTKVSPRLSVWRSAQYEKNKEEKPMFLNLPAGPFADFIAKKQKEWIYYQLVTRERKKIKGIESEIRKPWDIQNPENAVPVI